MVHTGISSIKLLLLYLLSIQTTRVARYPKKDQKTGNQDFGPGIRKRNWSKRLVCLRLITHTFFFPTIAFHPLWGYPDPHPGS